MGHWFNDQRWSGSHSHASGEQIIHGYSIPFGLMTMTWSTTEIEMTILM
jgi:hypothetical protein